MVNKIAKFALLSMMSVGFMLSYSSVAQGGLLQNGGWCSLSTFLGCNDGGSQCSSQGKVCSIDITNPTLSCACL
jgi:hypothetical protein